MSEAVIGRLARRAALAAAALVLLCTTGAVAQQPGGRKLPPAIEALTAAARQEGEVVIFGVTLNPSQVDTLAKAISAFYGFPIKLNMIAGLHVQKSVEVVEAVRNGAPSGMDVFWSTAARIEVLKRGNVLTPVDWAGELGLDPALKWGDHGLRAHDGMLTNLVYSTEMVKAGDVPKTYADMLNPRWKGRIAIPRSPSPWVNLSFAIGEDATVALVTALMRDQQAKILPRYPDVIARVVNGEFPLGIGADAYAQIAKGAPIGQADLDILVVVPWAYAITRDARHPAAAKLWGYWTVTPEGRATLDQVHGLSSILANGTSMWKFAQGKKVHIVSYDYAVEHEDRLSAKFGQILGIVR